MKFNINKVYTYNGSRNIFFQKVEDLNKKKLFKYKKNENIEDEFEFIANSSFGLATINGKPGSNGITIYADIETESDNNQIITLKTETRLEVSLTIIVSVIMYAFGLFNIQEVPFWFFLLPPLCVYWFHSVYRLQEKKLLTKIEKHLDLIPENH